MSALVYAFWLPRGRGRACPARGFPISARLPYTAGPHICGPYTSAIYFTMQQRQTSPERSRPFPTKHPRTPSVGRGLDPSAEVCPIPGIHRQPRRHYPKRPPPAPPAGRRGRRPLQRPASFPTIVHARVVCGMAYPGRCSTWNICRTFLLEKTLFYPFCLCYNRYKRP